MLNESVTGSEIEHDRKEKKVFYGIRIFFIVAILICAFLLSENIARWIMIVSVLGLSAGIIIKNIDNSGILSILLLAYTPFSAFLKKLANFAPAEFLADIYNNIIYWVLDHIGYKNSFELEEESCLLITFWLFVGCCCIIHSIYKRRITLQHTEFPEKNFTEKCDMFCKTLRQRIDRVNRETDWNENTFTPLDAEIEACINKKRKKKYDDLLKCLKSYRKHNTVFLVLGDPGAGKSVALRKLTLDLLDEVCNTELVPVYIDLKKWSEQWNLDHLPTKNDLISFIKDILMENGDFSSDDFVDVYFEKMLENGRWYFIFDSFDEMPCLMGMKNCKELIDEISDLFYNFLTGPGQNGGVIASRLFRSPTETLRPTVTMTIQPFSDIKIKTMLRKYASSSYDMDRKLFGEREDLVALCRNPFYLSLLINYFKYNGGELPINQMALYNSFINKRLNRCSGKIERDGMTVLQLREAGRRLAIYMNQSQKYGLECPLNELHSLDDNKEWHVAINLLAYAKICRFGGENNTVSFVHRRFQEFFYVESIIEKKEDITEEKYECIVRNSGFRDTLVLYCEVASAEQSKNVAEYCWKVIQKNINYQKDIHQLECRELVNTLYFMTEAFRNRKGVMSGFLDNFGKLVEDSFQIRENKEVQNEKCKQRILEKVLEEYRALRRYKSKKYNDLTIQKRNHDADLNVLLAFANSMVLFDSDRIQKLVLNIFKMKIRWLNDIVMLNCRLMKTKLDHRIENEIILYLKKLPLKIFFSRYKNTNFSFSLSKQFRYIQVLHTLRLIYILSFSMLIVATFIVLYSGGNIASISQIEMTSPILQTTYILISLFFVMPVNSSLHRSIGFPFDSMISMILFCVILLVRLSILVFKNEIALLCISIWDSVSLIYIMLPLIYDLLLFIYRDIKSFFIMLLKVTLVLVPIVIVILSIPPLFFIKICYLCLIGMIVFFVANKYGRKMLFEAFCATIIDPVRYIYDYIVDRKWWKEYIPIDRITRSQLVSRLQDHPTSKWRKVYVDSLLEKKVILTGEWPEGTRPIFDDDELDFKIMKLDCVEMNDLYKCY